MTNVLSVGDRVQVRPEHDIPPIIRGDKPSEGVVDSISEDGSERERQPLRVPRPDRQGRHRGPRRTLYVAATVQSGVAAMSSLPKLLDRRQIADQLGVGLPAWLEPAWDDTALWEATF